MVAEIVKEVKVPQAALSVPAHETGDTCHTPVTEGEEVGVPIPAPGFLQVTERRRKYHWSSRWHRRAAIIGDKAAYV